MCDFWWTQWHCDEFFLEYYWCPLTTSFPQCFILIFILLLLLWHEQADEAWEFEQNNVFWGITEHWIEKYYRICNQRECLDWKINEVIIQIICLSCGHWPGMTHLTLNEQKIPLVNHEVYLSVLFLTNITWRIHIETQQTKAFYWNNQQMQLYAVNFISLLSELSREIKFTAYSSICWLFK